MISLRLCMQFLKVHSHSTICDCYLVLLVMDCIGVCDTVAVALYKDFHWFLCNPFIAIRGIAVAIRKKMSLNSSSFCNLTKYSMAPFRFRWKWRSLLQFSTKHCRLKHLSFFTIRISVRLSDRSKVTQIKINFVKNCPQWGFELTTSGSSVPHSVNCARGESVGDF